MTVGLAMIVRDAAATIQACLATAKPHLDFWTIIDTGSVDGTPELVGEAMIGVPGRLLHEPWENFEVNRTSLMAEACGTADYLMLLDADMEVIHPGPLPDLTAEVYMGRLLGNNLDYTLPILVKGDRQWSYRGVAHSYLHCDEGYDSVVLPGLQILDHSSTGAAKLERDLDALSKEHARQPLDARTAFYLAQTYYDLDRFPEAIAMYRYRSNLQGWDEERFYARFMLGVLLCEHVSFAEGAQELLRAWGERPTRIEPLRCLANAAHSVADKAAYPTDQLFVHRDKYVRPAAVAPKIPAEKVSAIVVTRGNVDLTPILASLPYDDVVIWDNSKKNDDQKIYGRYLALRKAKHDVVYMQDDDVIFTAHDRLLAEYEPGVAVANMDAPWVEACGYHDLVLFGAGSICDKRVLKDALARYLAVYPADDEFLLECDFVVGTLVPGRKVDLGYTPREFTDDPDRLYRQPWQQALKDKFRQRAREIRDGMAVAT